MTTTVVKQITFVVNTPIWKSFTFEDFKLLHLEKGTSEEKAQQIWDRLVKKAKKVEGKFAEFIEESMTGIDVGSDCLEDAETEINDLIEEKLEEVKEELEEEEKTETDSEEEEGEVKEEDDYGQSDAEEEWGIDADEYLPYLEKMLSEAKGDDIAKYERRIRNWKACVKEMDEAI